MSSRRRDNPSLYLSGITSDMRNEEIQNLFEKYGKVKDVYIPKDFYTGETRGFAYVQFFDDEAAETAYRRNEHVMLRDQKLSVQWAKGSRKSANEMRDRTAPRRRRRSYSRSRSPRGRRSPSRERYDRRRDDRDRYDDRRRDDNDGYDDRRRGRNDDDRNGRSRRDSDRYDDGPRGRSPARSPDRSRHDRDEGRRQSGSRRGSRDDRVEGNGDYRKREDSRRPASPEDAYNGQKYPSEGQTNSAQQDYVPAPY